MTRAARAFCARFRLCWAIVRSTRFCLRSPRMALSLSFARLYASIACSNEPSRLWICTMTLWAWARFDATLAGSAVAALDAARAAAKAASMLIACCFLKYPGGPRRPAVYQRAGRTLIVLDKCGTLTTWPDSCKWPLCYLPALVRAPGRGLRTLCLAVLTGAVALATLPGAGSAGTAGELTGRGALATLPGAGSAETAGELQRRADELRADNARLSVGSRSAVESLAAIESRLAEARAELASFNAKAANVQDRRRAVLEELAVAR